MTGSDETVGPPELLDDGRERRLHPFSPLFVLISQLRNAAFPVVLLLFFGRGSWMELGGLVAAGALALYSLVYSLGFRYRLGPGALFVKEGILGRTERHIPYERIQNIVQQRSPLHRLFGVTQLRLESAGGLTAEAAMTVITSREAERIERVLRGHAPAGARGAAAEEAALFELTNTELARLGLVTNRGLVVVGAVFAVLSQVQPPWEGRRLRGAVDIVWGFGRDWSVALPDWTTRVVAVVVLAGVFLVVLKLLSIGMAFVTFHRFRLTLEGERVSTEMGLLTRRTASARRDKIQRLLVGETWLARRLGRRWLSCDVAAGMRAMNEGEASRLRWLAPIATEPDLERLSAAVAPGVSLARQQWRGLHPRAWRRRFVVPAAVVTLACAAAYRLAGLWVVAAWVALVAWLWLEARGWARFSGYAFDGEVLGVRTGWLSREWALTRIEKGQVVQLRRTPFDRRHGMATVVLDTAGAGFGGRASAVPYLPESEARELTLRLRRGM